MRKGHFRQNFALAIVILLMLFIMYGVYSFINGFFGALLLYVVLFPVYNFMIKKNWNKKLSAAILIFASLLIIIVPLLVVLGIIGNEVINLFQNTELIEATSKTIVSSVGKIMPGFSAEVLKQQLTRLGISVATLFFGIANNVVNVVINLLIAFFLLYFMLVEGPIFDKIREILPFNNKNSHKLTDKLKDVSYSTVLVSGVIALVQGGLLTTAFLIFGIENAFLWGFITGVLSFLPVLGPPVVWIPAVIIQFLKGDYMTGGGILFFGIVLSNIDNFIRPYLGNSISKIHPLVILIGIFVGVSLFGIIGLFVGPLLLAFSLLVLKMYKEEYGV